MKIKPEKDYRTPKYAAVLAAAALLPVLTGCGQKPEIMGLMPVRVSESDTQITTETMIETEIKT
ncbi:MAG: hypothetical protein MJ065_09315 [Oscillospiraceae bacterium]|nr:hypothetical protein [Oscillospiraceae bacterium]